MLPPNDNCEMPSLSLFLHNYFFKENLAPTLTISLRIRSISVPFFTCLLNPYPKHLLWEIGKKCDAYFVSWCAKHCFVLEEMTHSIVRFSIFESSTVYDQMNSSFYFIRFIIAQDHQHLDPWTFNSKKFQDILGDLQTAKKQIN